MKLNFYLVIYGWLELVCEVNKPVVSNKTLNDIALEVLNNPKTPITITTDLRIED